MVFNVRSLLFINSKFTLNVICKYITSDDTTTVFTSQVGIEARLANIHDRRQPLTYKKIFKTMLSYIRRAQRRRMYERANSDSGQFNANEPESPSSPGNSSTGNGQNSEGFHFYSTVKKQHSLPEVGEKNSTQKTRLNAKHEEKLNDAKTTEMTKNTTSGQASL